MKLITQIEVITSPRTNRLGIDFLCLLAGLLIHNFAATKRTTLPDSLNFDDRHLGSVSLKDRFGNHRNPESKLANSHH